MSLLNPILTRITDESGRPVPYALLYVYLAGTSTPVEVFADAELTTPRTNPVVCGGAEAPGVVPAVYVNDADRLRLVYQDADGVTLYDADDVEAAAAARTIIEDVDGATYLYTAADVGRITRRSHTAGMVDTLSAAAAMGNGAAFTVINDSEYGLVLAVTGGGTIDGELTVPLRAGSQVTVISDGTEYTKRPQSLGFGYHSQSLPAGFWEARPTNPAVYGVLALPTNNLAIRRWEFDDATEQGICGRFTTPVAWDGGPFLAAVRWQSDILAGSQVRFAIRARAIGNAEDIDQAYGAAATVDDASNGPGTSLAGCEMLTDWVEVTPAAVGSNNGGKTLLLEVTRPVFGTLPHPIYVSDVVLRFNLNKENDNL